MDLIHCNFARSVHTVLKEGLVPETGSLRGVSRAAGRCRRGCGSVARVHGATDHCCDLLFVAFTSSHWGVTLAGLRGSWTVAWAPAGSGLSGHRLMDSVAGEAPAGPPHKEPSAQPLGTPRVSGGCDDERKEDQLAVGAGRMLSDESWPGVPSGARLARPESRGAPRPRLQHIRRLEGAPPANHGCAAGFRAVGWGPAKPCSRRTALHVSAFEACSGHSASGRVDSPSRRGGWHSGELSASRSRGGETGERGAGSVWRTRLSDVGELSRLDMAVVQYVFTHTRIALVQYVFTHTHMHSTCSIRVHAHTHA